MSLQETSQRLALLSILHSSHPLAGSDIPLPERTVTPTLDETIHTDEGYIEQRFEPPKFMAEWSDEQKAEFAYQLLLTVSTENTLRVVDRLAPLLHRDLLSLLPCELALHILGFLDAASLLQMTCVSRHWKLLSDDQRLWRQLFHANGWKSNQKAMENYLRSSCQISKPSRKELDAIHRGFSSIPLARTTPSGYDVAAFSARNAAPSLSMSGRIRPYRAPDDLLLRIRQRRENHASSLLLPPRDPMSPSTSSSSAADVTFDPEHNDFHTVSHIPSSEAYTRLLACVPKGPSSPLPSASSSGTAVAAATLFASSAVSPSSHSRSQPLLTGSIRDTSSSSLLLRRDTSIRNSSSTHTRSHVYEGTTSDYRFKNCPLPRRFEIYDESALYHYNDVKDERFINWRRLYHNRTCIERRWREGKCKMRVFPPENHRGDMHMEGIYCIQYDNDKIVSGSRDHTIKIWDMRTGECRKTLYAHTRSVLCLQYDDEFLFSGSSDTTIIQWNIRTGQIVRTLRGHSESVLNLRFQKDQMVSCSKDKTVRIWNLKTGTVSRVLRGHRAAVNAVQFKGNRVVSASGDRAIKLWDMETGKCLKTFDSHTRGIACVEFNGNHIVSGSSDQTIKIWNAATGECLHTLIGHMALVRSLQVDANTDRIVSGSYDSSLKIWSLKQGCLVRSVSQAIEGRILNVQFDFARIVCCSNLGKIVIYDFSHGIDTQFLL